MATTPQPAQPQPHSAPAQPTDAESLRQVVAHQPTVEGSLAALLQAIFSVMSEALERGEPARLAAFRDKLGDDPKAWRDAVLANTPSAVLSTGPFVGLPSDVQKAFDQYAMQHSQKPQEEAKTEKK